MTAATAIEWTEQSWNPIVGCSVVSPGCTNCYAMKMAGRLEAMSVAHESAHDGDPGPLQHYRGATQETRAGFVWTGKVGFNENALLQPLRRRKPTIYFVNSMGDLFHESVPDEWIDRVFAVMALAPRHTFQVLTKRSARMREYFDDPYVESRIGRAKQMMTGFVDPEWTWPLPNVWLGVSVEDQARADERVPDLLATPAAIRWLSCEPLLGPVDLTDIRYHGADRTPLWHMNSLTGAMLDWSTREPLQELPGAHPAKLDWIVCGGESGKDARPMHPDWARSLRDQCAAAGPASSSATVGQKGTPFFFKQWGEWAPASDASPINYAGHSGFQSADDSRRVAWPDGHIGNGRRETNGGGGWLLERIGKKRAGRLLDGVLHDGFPA